MNEAQYQTRLIKKIKKIFPGCVVLKNDPRFIQGLPDIIVLYMGKWGMLEVKRSEEAEILPNQQYYIDELGAMSFASFIYPENEEDVLDALQHALGLTREARIS